MPSGYVKKLASETGKSEAEIEKLWKKAKGIAAETLGKKEGEFTSSEYKYVTGIVKNMLGINEEILDPSNFLNSDKNASEYIEAIVTSGDFTIGNVKPPKKKKDDEEEDEDDDEEEDKDEEKNYKRKPKQNGTGPHGRGNGPGQGKSDGSGLKDEDEDFPTEELDKIINENLDQ